MVNALRLLRFLIFAGLGIGMATRVPMGPAVAQNMLNGRMEFASAQLLPPPRTLRQEIRLVREAIDAERTSDAVIKLGELLRRLPADEALPALAEEELTQDYFLLEANVDREDWSDGDEEAPLAVSTTRLVRNLIGQLPAAALETYELRYGPMAKLALAEAAKTRDWNEVERVRREFFHTWAGYEASALLAQREWQLGNPLAASLLLDELMSVPRAIQHLGDAVVILHAAATFQSGGEVGLPNRLPKAFLDTMTSGDNSEADRTVAWRVWVAKQFPPRPLSAAPVATDYPYLGGNGQRNAREDGQMPLSNPRWMLETSASPRQERAIEKKTAEWKSNGQLPPPSWTPLRIGDQLVMRTTQWVLGVDYRTGKRVWQYPWFTPTPMTPPVDDDDSGLSAEEDPDAILVQRVWNDVPYGQLSSDGERVYMIDDLSKVEVQRFGPFGMQDLQTENANKNTLVALDLATEGKLLWRLGAQATNPSAFSEAFFLGPPLPVRGKLYAMVEIAGEITLVCLRPEDGSLVWRQVLLSVESGGIETDPIRRVAGATPTYHQGLLICPTGGGATVAIDLIDRTLRWCNLHYRNQQFVQSVFRNTPDVSMKELGQRWSGPAAMASGRTLVLTPPESDRLIVSDVVSGENRFDAANRIHDLYVAGLRDGRYYVVSAGRFSAHSVDNGAMLWSTPSDLVAPGSRVSGRGVFGPVSYFLPTTTDELIEISLEDGSVLNRRIVRFPLGNLVAVDGELISQSTTQLAVAYGQSSLQPRVDAILATDPDDFTALVRKAELLIEQGARDKALDMLARARDLEPDNDEVLMLSINAMLGTLRDNPASTSIDLDLLERLIDRPEQRAQLLVLRISGILDQTPTDQRLPVETALKAFSLLLDLSRLAIEQPALQQDHASIFAKSDRQFTLDSWIAAQVHRLVSTAEPAAESDLIAAANDHLQSLGSRDLSSLQQAVRHFTTMAVADPLRLELANRLVRLGDPLAAERWLIGETLATNAARRSLATPRIAELAKLYGELQWTADATALSRLAEQRSSEGNQRPDQDAAGGTDVGDQLGRDAQPPASMVGSRWQSPADWPAGVDLQWMTNNSSRTRSIASDRHYDDSMLLMGEHLQGWQFLRDSSSSLWILNPYGIGRMLGLEGLSGRDAMSRDVVVSGGLMLIMTPSELIAVDLFQVLGQMNDSLVRWRRSFGAEGEAIAKRTSSTSPFGDQVFRFRMNSNASNSSDAELRLGPILGDRLFVMQGTELVCLDALSGQPMWRTSEFAPGGAVVAGDGRVAVVSDRYDMITVFDALDGHLIETKKRIVDGIMMASGRNVLAVSRLADLPGGVPEDLGEATGPGSLVEELKRSQSLYDPHLVELFDAISGERLQHRIASEVNRDQKPRSAAYGQMISARYFALLDNEGRATVWDVLTGEQRVDTKVPVQADLFDLSAVQLQDQWLLLPRSRNPVKDLGTTTTTMTVSGGASVSPLTAIISLSMVDGSVRWSREFDEPWGCTTMQPWSTPLLILIRGHSYYSSPAARRRELDVMAVNVDSGKTRHEIFAKNTSSRNNSIETQVKLLPHRDEVRVELQGEALSYQFKPLLPGQEGEIDDDSTTEFVEVNEDGSIKVQVQSSVKKPTAEPPPAPQPEIPNVEVVPLESD